jgi:NADPH2:quinone reductase
MRAWKAEQFGEAVNVLAQVDVELPEPDKDSVELQVVTAGVGLPDALMVRGNYPAVQKPPVVPGQEIVGVITRAGANVAEKVGDKVIAMTQFAFGMGGFAERCMAHKGSLYPIPKGMPDEQAAGFFVPYHTAYVGLAQRGELKAGETLLVLGGAGSSGSAAIQLGKALGATVIATASSAGKLDFCKSQGADHTINYRETPIHKAVKEITGGAGVNMVYDPVGGDAYAQSAKAMAQHGRIILIGYSSGEWANVDPLHTVLRSYSVVGAFAGARTREETLQQHAKLSKLFEDGKINVPVDKIFPFDHAPQAIDRVATNKAVGKVIVKVS